MEDGDLGAEQLAEQAARAGRKEFHAHERNVFALTQSFLALENFFAQRENVVPKLPVGHAITIIKLQDETIIRLKRDLQTAIDHLKDWALTVSSSSKFSVGDHDIYKPQISVDSVRRLNMTIKMLEDI